MADLHYAYDTADGSGRNATRMYLERFPNRCQTSHVFLGQLHRRLCESRAFEVRSPLALLWPDVKHTPPTRLSINIEQLFEGPLTKDRNESIICQIEIDKKKLLWWIKVKEKSLKKKTFLKFKKRRGIGHITFPKTQLMQISLKMKDHLSIPFSLWHKHTTAYLWEVE